MRCLERNKRPFWYCLYSGTSTVSDTYGNETGTEVLYHEPVKMMANISEATGQYNIQQFGGIANYDKVIVTDDMSCPIDEDTVLIVDAPFLPTNERSPRNGAPVVGIYELPGTVFVYDYIVIRVSRSLNNIAIAIRKVNVS